MTNEQRLQKIDEKLDLMAIKQAEDHRHLVDIHEKCSKFSDAIYGNGQPGLKSNIDVIDTRLSTIETTCSKRHALRNNLKSEIISGGFIVSISVVVGWLISKI